MCRSGVEGAVQICLVFREFLVVWACGGLGVGLGGCGFTITFEAERFE